MDKETEGQDGNHDVDYGRGHEVAAQLEPTVSMAVGHVIGRNLAENAAHGIDDGEKVDGPVKKQEDDEECARNTLDELLADG